MKLKQIIFTVSVIVGLSVVVSCTKDGSSGETKISRSGDTKSHNIGQNCLNCHKSGGSGEVNFNVAGTVYNRQLTATFPNAVVKFYTRTNGGGTSRATISCDAKGNFYTTENIDFQGGLFPAIVGNNGSIQYMLQLVTTGDCARCHGSSTAKLWVD